MLVDKNHSPFGSMEGYIVLKFMYVQNPWCFSAFLTNPNLWKPQPLDKPQRCGSFVFFHKALSIGGFASMMVDGTLVNTHLRAARPGAVTNKNGGEMGSPMNGP